MCCEQSATRDQWAYMPLLNINLEQYFN